MRASESCEPFRLTIAWLELHSDKPYSSPRGLALSLYIGVINFWLAWLSKPLSHAIHYSYTKKHSGKPTVGFGSLLLLGYALSNFLLAWLPLCTHSIK